MGENITINNTINIAVNNTNIINNTVRTRLVLVI